MTDQTTAATNGQPPGEETAWTTVVGTIRKGMPVIDAEGTCIGRVASLAGDEIMLEPQGDGQEAEFVTLTQVDGVDETGVLLSGRGDAMFGLGGEP